MKRYYVAAFIAGHWTQISTMFCTKPAARAWRCFFAGPFKTVIRTVPA